MPDFGFVRQQFNGGDSMWISPRGLTFIRVAPHFLPGILTISVVSNTSTFVNFTAEPGSSYVFESHFVFIDYSASALAPCEVTIWKIRSGCEHAAYTWNAYNARIYADEVDRDFQFCWFLQFPGAVKLNFNRFDPSKAHVELLQMNGSVYTSFQFPDTFKQILQESTFVIVIWSRASFFLDIESQSTVFDWGDREGFFTDCRKSLDCKQNTSEVKDYIGFVIRKMPYNWLIAPLVILSVALGTIVVLLFWNAGSEFSMGSGMRPLGKVVELPFT
jgi:hypothetical protein